MEFPIEKVKKALEEPCPEVTGDLRIDSQLVVIRLDVTFRDDPVDVCFVRDKVIPEYQKALDNNHKTVTIEYEAPSPEDFEKVGLKKEGDFYVPDKS